MAKYTLDKMLGLFWK